MSVPEVSWFDFLAGWLYAERAVAVGGLDVISPSDATQRARAAYHVYQDDLAVKAAETASRQ